VKCLRRRVFLLKKKLIIKNDIVLLQRAWPILMEERNAEESPGGTKKCGIKEFDSRITTPYPYFRICHNVIYSFINFAYLTVIHIP